MTDPADPVAGSPGPAFALGPDEPVTVVLADANALFGRCVRDYLMYADRRDLIRIRWSEHILEEMARSQVARIESFTDDKAQRLCELMNAAAPEALVEPTAADFAVLQDVRMPDEDDRPVLAAAIAADADVLCTCNTKHFPTEAITAADIMRITPDQLLAALTLVHPEEMLVVHRTTVRSLPRATDESTLAALRRSQCGLTAARMQALLAIPSTDPAG